MAIGTIGALLAGSIGSAAIGASASKRAGDTAARGARGAQKLQERIYNEQSANYAPYRQSGNNAMAAILYEMGLGPKPTVGGTAPEITQTQSGRKTSYGVGGQSFSSMSAAEAYADANKTGGTEYAGYSESPMAKYMLEKGMEGIDGSASARGNLYSGATLSALENDRQRVIKADTGDYFNRLFNIKDTGLQAAGNQGQAGSNYASNAGNAMMQGANAQAGGIMGQGQAFQTGISDAAGIYGYFSNPMQAYAKPALFGGNSWGA